MNQAAKNKSVTAALVERTESKIELVKLRPTSRRSYNRHVHMKTDMETGKLTNKLTCSVGQALAPVTREYDL